MRTWFSVATGLNPRPMSTARAPAPRSPPATESSCTAPSSPSSAVARNEIVSEYTPPVAKTSTR